MVLRKTKVSLKPDLNPGHGVQGIICYLLEAAASPQETNKVISSNVFHLILVSDRTLPGRWYSPSTVLYSSVT